MRNNENGNSRSGRSAAAVRLVLLALIFVTVFAVVLSCGAGTEAPLFGSVTDNVAEAAHSGGDGNQVTSYSGSSTTIASLQEQIHDSTIGSASITTNLSDVTFSDSNVSYYKTGGTSEGIVFWNGGTASSWGTNAAGQHWMYSPEVIVAVNIKVPDSVMAFVNAGYTVTVSYSAMVYTSFDNNQTNGTYMALTSSAVAASNFLNGDAWKKDGWTTFDGGPTGGTSRNFGTLTITGGNSNLVLGLARNSGWYQTPGIRAASHNLTFNISRGSLTDGTRPTISNAAAEDGPQLKTSGGASVTASYLGSNSGLSANTTNITLGKAVSQATFSANGQNYFKKLTLTVRDGDPNSAAFYYGVRDLNITEAPGGVDGAWVHVGNLPQGNKENETTTASGTNYYITASNTTNAASQATFTLYFKANGTYTIKFEDNASAFGGQNAACDPITITVSGIDTDAPTATGLLGDSLTEGVFKDTAFDESTWASVGSVSQSLKGMDAAASLPDGNSAWAFFFDIADSFYKPTAEWAESTLAGVNASNIAKIKSGAAPFKVVNGTNTANFSYNFKEGTASNGSALSGGKLTGAGYYMIMVYIADVAGNVCATPFTYFVRVDNTTVTGTPTGVYSYLDKAGETQQVTTEQWINKYMIGDSARARIDISFNLNPAGNVVNFNFSSFAGTGTDNFANNSATVMPGTTADGEKLTVTIGDYEFATDTEGATVIIEGLGAELSAEIKVAGSGNTRTATLSLIYSRANGEFGVNSEPGVTVRSALGTATVYADGIVPVRIDTVSVNDLGLGTADGGNYLVANGGNDTVNAANGGYPENSISIDISTVEGRVWYTDENNAISVSTDKSTGDALLDAMLGAYAGKVYFGWKVYSDASAAGTTEGETVTPGAINSDYDAFKAAMDAVIGEGGTYLAGGLESAFTTFFGEGNSKLVQGEVNNILAGGGTLNGLAGADAGVRVLYVMTLDQAGNANFELYYVFVDTTTYTIKFETDEAYAAYFEGLGDDALRNIKYEATLRGDGMDGTYTTSFKRGQNIVVTAGTGTPGGSFNPGFPGGFVPYEVYKYTEGWEGPDPESLIYSHTRGGATGTDDNFVAGRLTNITTTGSDVAGGSYIAFVLDQAGNIGSLGSDLGLMFSYRKLVTTNVLNSKTYDGKAASGMVSVVTNANVTDTLATAALEDINSVIKWKNTAGESTAPVNAGSYQYSFDLNNAADKYFIAEKVDAARYEITKRNIDLLAAIGGADKWQTATYGDVYDRDYITQYLGAGALSGVTLETALGSSDLGQDNGKTLGDIMSGSGLVLANGKALSELVYSAGGGNLAVGSYALTASSGVTADNYTFSLSVSFEITKATITVSLKGSKTYAQPDSAAAVTLQIGSDDMMKGDSLTDIFGSSVDVNNATSRIINITSGYTYEGQGQYATAGDHAFTGVTYAGLSGNFDMKLSDTPGNMTVAKLTVYAIPDSGQIIYSPQTYTINFNYYYTNSNSGTAVTDATVRGEITAGTFVLSETPTAEHGEEYGVMVGNAFTATNNITIETFVDGITVTLEYDWSRNTLTISFVKVPTATYRVKFVAPTELEAYSFAVTDEKGAPVEGHGITVTSLGTPVLKGYAVENAANSTFTVEFPDLVIDGADKGDLNIVFNTQVTIGYLNVTLTPSFTAETEKTYGDPDDWTGKFSVTPSTDAAIGDFDLSALAYPTGALGRALYNASGFVRAGAANDDVNEMLAEGEYYAAYVSEPYSVNDPSIIVTVDEEALKGITFTVNAREIKIGTYGKDKEVPDGTANVPYADGEKAVFIQNLVSGDDAFLTWTSAVYVHEDGAPVTEGLDTGGQTGLYILVSGIALDGADKLNYTLTVSSKQFGGGYQIVALRFEALKSGDIVITKVYDATTAIDPETDIVIAENGNAFNLLKQYGYTVEFYGFNVAHNNYDLSDDAVGNYTVRPTFFVARLPETSFAEGGELWVVEGTDYGVGGVFITVNNVLATITPLPISFDMLKVDIVTTRPYDATTNVTRTIAWNTDAEGYNPAIHTRDNLSALRLRANITIESADAGEGKAVSFSDLTYATSGSNLTVDGNFAAAAAAHFTSQTVTVTPVDITVNFDFEKAVYGNQAPVLTGGTDYNVATPYAAWETEKAYFDIDTDGADFYYYNADSTESTEEGIQPYLYVQYDENGNVRLHDVYYDKVTFKPSADAPEGFNLGNYTFGGKALEGSTFSGVIREAAVLTPKPLEYDTSGLAGATKVYDGTTNAAPALEALIGEGDINVFFGEDGVLAGDLTLVKIAYTATYRDAQAGTGNTITVSGIEIVANGDSETAKAAAGSYSIPVSNKLVVENATITKAPLLVTFKLPDKDWDGTVFVSESEITYVLGGDDYDFAIAEDRSKYSVTFTAGGYSDPNVAETVSGTVYNVVLKNNSGNVNYYLVESSGNALTRGDYSTGVDDPNGTAVAKYADGYVFAGGGNNWAIASATGKINKAVYEVEIVLGTEIVKPYDGTTDIDHAEIEHSFAGLDAAILANLSLVGAEFADPSVGTHDVIITLEYTGEASANFEISKKATVKGRITARAITVSVDSEKAGFTYGEEPDYSDALSFKVDMGEGLVDATIEGGKIMINGEEHGDVSEISLVSDAFVLVSGRYANAGIYKVTGVNGTATNFVFVIAEGQTVVIDKATLTVGAADREYVSGSDINKLRADVVEAFEFIGLAQQDDTTRVTITGDIAEIVKFVKDGSVELAANAAPGAKYQITLDLTKATSANYVFEAGSVGVVTVVLPEFNAAAVSGIGVVYDGTDKLAGEGSAELLDSLVTYNVQTGKTYEIALADAAQAINAGSYDFDVVVTVIHSDLEGYASGDEAYEKSAPVHVTLTVDKAPLTVSRGEGITVAYNGSAQKLTDYEGFFVFDGAVEAEKDEMLAAIGATYTLSGTTDAKDTFTGAGVYSVVLVTDDPVFGNYTVASRVTTLNVGKAPVIVLGTKLEGDITSGDEFGIVELSVEPADGCAVPESTVKKLTASVTYVSGSASVGTITSAGRYNYTVALSDPANYQIVSTENASLGTVGATGTITVSVSAVQTGTGEGEQFVQQAEIVFGTPETKAWVLTATELTSGTTYNNYESIVSRTVSLGQQAEIDGVISLTLTNGTEVINASSVAGLSSVSEITVKLPAAVGSSLEGYTVYERQKDGSLRAIDGVVNDGYFTYNSSIVSDLVFVRIIGAGVPVWIWILVGVLAALIIFAIILAVFIGRKDRSTPPPAAPAEPPAAPEPPSHDGALTAASADVDIPDAPSHIGGSEDRPPLIGIR